MASPWVLGCCWIWFPQPSSFCPRAGLSLLQQVPSSSQGDMSTPALLGASTSDPQPWPGSAPQLLAVQWIMQLPVSCALSQVHPHLQPCLLLLLPETPVLPAGARPGSCWQLAVPAVSSHTCWPSCCPRALGSGRALPPASWALGQPASRAWTQWAVARACSCDPPVPLCLWRAVPCSCQGKAVGMQRVPYIGLGPFRVLWSQQQQPGGRLGTPGTRLGWDGGSSPAQELWLGCAGGTLGRHCCQSHCRRLDLAASPGPGRDAQPGLSLPAQPRHCWALYPEPSAPDE